MPEDVFKGKSRDPAVPKEENWRDSDTDDDPPLPDLIDSESDDHEEENTVENVQPPVEGQQPVNVQPPVEGQLPENVQPTIEGQQPQDVQSPIEGQQPEDVQPPIEGQQPENVQPPIDGQQPENEQQFQIFPTPEQQQTNLMLAMKHLNIVNPGNNLLLFNPNYFPSFLGETVTEQEVVHANLHLLRGLGRAARGNISQFRGRGRAEPVAQENASPSRGRGRAEPIFQGSESPSRESDIWESIVRLSQSPSRVSSRAEPVFQGSASLSRGFGTAELVAQSRSPSRGRSRAGPLEQGTAFPSIGGGRAGIQGNTPAPIGHGIFRTEAIGNVVIPRGRSRVHGRGFGFAYGDNQIFTDEHRVGREGNINTNEFRATGVDENENEPQEAKDFQEDFDNENP